MYKLKPKFKNKRHFKRSPQMKAQSYFKHFKSYKIGNNHDFQRYCTNKGSQYYH